MDNLNELHQQVAKQQQRKADLSNKLQALAFELEKLNEASLEVEEKNQKTKREIRELTINIPKQRKLNQLSQKNLNDEEV